MSPPYHTQFDDILLYMTRGLFLYSSSPFTDYLKYLPPGSPDKEPTQSKYTVDTQLKCVDKGSSVSVCNVTLDYPLKVNWPQI